jgi:hypothetical protein
MREIPEGLELKTLRILANVEGRVIKLVRGNPVIGSFFAVERPVFKSLLAKGWVTLVFQPPELRERRERLEHYCLTKKGRQALSNAPQTDAPALAEETATAKALRSQFGVVQPAAK